MKWERKGDFKLGSNVIELLIPQRRPFAMVDFVDSFSTSPLPAIEAGRHISQNEIYFDGHFPGLHVWPGTLTVEGLGQSAAILVTLMAIRRVAEAEGMDPDAAVDALRNVERGFRLHPGYRSKDAELFLGRLRSLSSVNVAVGASVEMKFLKPVFAGQRLDYRMVMTTELGEMMRFEAEACVDGATVAAGVMTGARLTRPPATG